MTPDHNVERCLLLKTKAICHKMSTELFFLILSSFCSGFLYFSLVPSVYLWFSLVLSGSICLFVVFSGSLSGCQIGLEIEALYCTAPPLNWGHSPQNEQRITSAQNEPRIILSYLLEVIFTFQKRFCRRWDFQSSVIKLIRVLFSTLKNKIYFRWGNEFLQRDCKMICTCGSDKLILGSSKKKQYFTFVHLNFFQLWMIW